VNQVSRSKVVWFCLNIPGQLLYLEPGSLRWSVNSGAEPGSLNPSLPHSGGHLQNTEGARFQGSPFPNFMKIHAQLSEILFTGRTRHRASTSMYSLTFRVRVASPKQYGRNGTASLQKTSHTPNLHVDFIAGACVVRAACAGPGGLPLGSATHFHDVAIATHPVHRLQIRPVVHN